MEMVKESTTSANVTVWECPEFYNQWTPWAQVRTGVISLAASRLKSFL